MLYVLANRLLMPKLQNYIIDHLWLKSYTIKGTRIDWIYKNTSPQNQLRRLCVNKVAVDLTEDNLRELSRTRVVPTDLLVDLALVYRRPALSCRRTKACASEGHLQLSRMKHTRP